MAKLTFDPETLTFRYKHCYDDPAWFNGVPYGPVRRGDGYWCVELGEFYASTDEFLRRTGRIRTFDSIYAACLDGTTAYGYHWLFVLEGDALRRAAGIARDAHGEPSEEGAS